MVAEQVMKFEKGLNDSLEPIRSRMLTTVLFPNRNVVFNMAINHERRQSVVNLPQAMCVKHEESQAGMSVSFNQNLQKTGFSAGQGSSGSMCAYVNPGNVVTSMANAVNFFKIAIQGKEVWKPEENLLLYLL